MTQEKKRCGTCLHHPPQYSASKTLRVKVEEEDTSGLAQQVKQKLEKVDADFKALHYDLINVIDGEEGPVKEQDTLNNYDDEIAVLTVRVHAAIDCR